MRLRSLSLLRRSLDLGYVPSQMATPNVRCLATVFEPLRGVLANGFEHGVALLARHDHPPSNKAVVHECPQLVEHIGLVRQSIAHGGGGRQGEPSHEHPEPTEQ